MQLFERIMADKPHPEMGYRACLGLIRLARKYSSARMVGKSFVASCPCAEGVPGCYSALYMGAAALFRDLAIARVDGSLRLLLARFSRIDVLVIDDWAMVPLSETGRRGFWEICEDPVSNALARSHFATAGHALARKDRQPNCSGWHSRPLGSQCTSH